MATAGPNSPSANSNLGSYETSLSPATNVYVEDGSVAQAGIMEGQSDWQAFSGFGFSIPEDATIDGIVLRIKRRSAMGSVTDVLVQLLKAGDPVGANKASGVPWGGSLAYETYGAEDDLWDTTWTPAQLNAGAFGFVFSFYLSEGTFFDPAMAEVDHADVTVYYTEAEGGGGSSRRASRKLLKGL